MRKTIVNIINLVGLVFIITALSCQRSTTIQGRDWTTWKGPFANGTTDEKDWTPEALSDSSRIIWQVDIGKGHSAVAVKGEYVYTFGNSTVIENQDTTNYDLITCLNSNDGSVIWSYKYESKEGEFPGPCSSPVLDGENLYTLSKNGDLLCLNALSGQVKWNHQITELGYQPPGFGFSCSPLIIDEMLLLKAGASGIAFDKNTGEKIWAGDTITYNSYSSVMKLNSDSNEKLLLLNGDSLHVVETKTGQILLSHPWSDIGNDPIISDSTVLLSNQQVGSVLLDISKSTPEEIWANDSIKGLFQGFVSYGKYAYGFTSKGRTMPLTCFNLENGNIEWEEDLERWGSLSLADNKLIIITGKGKLIIAEANPEKFTEISSRQIFNIDEEGFKKNRNCCWTMPVLSHGKIYARTNMGKLACIDMNI